MNEEKYINEFLNYEHLDEILNLLFHEYEINIFEEFLKIKLISI